MEIARESQSEPIGSEILQNNNNKKKSHTNQFNDLILTAGFNVPRMEKKHLYLNQRVVITREAELLLSKQINNECVCRENSKGYRCMRGAEFLTFRASVFLRYTSGGGVSL